jgi:hypothetical protein
MNIEFNIKVGDEYILDNNIIIAVTKVHKTGRVKLGDMSYQFTPLCHDARRDEDGRYVADMLSWSSREYRWGHKTAMLATPVRRAEFAHRRKVFEAKEAIHSAERAMSAVCRSGSDDQILALAEKVRGLI